MAIREKDIFAIKMLNIYDIHEERLKEIVEDRENWESRTDDRPETTHHKRLLEIYDMYDEIKNKDKEVAQSLYATCLWYIHMNIADVDMTFAEQDEKGNLRLKYGTIANYIIRKYMVVSANGVTYIFINNMYYEDTGRIKKDIEKILERGAYSEERKTEAIKREIVTRIKDKTMKFRGFPFNKKAKYLVPVLNGVVVRRQLNKLLPQSPVWGFTYSLPIEYEPDAPTLPVRKFISEIISKENQELLFQIPAQALLHNENYQQSYLLTGGGANGKSTYISLIRELIGSDNITSVSLQELEESKFKIAELQGKLMNLYADLPKTSMKTTGMFKILTGGDTVTVEKKYAHPFEMVNKAVFVFSANELPDVTDATFAFWRRWAVIEFPNQFAVDPNFKENLITHENLSGFFNVVLQKMDEIEHGGGLKYSEKVEEIMQLWKKRSNSAFAFVSDILAKDIGGFVPKDNIWTSYLKYCDENDFTQLPKNKLKEEIERIGGIDTMLQHNKQRFRVFKGVRLKTDPPSEAEAQSMGRDPTIDAKLEVNL